MDDFFIWAHRGNSARAPENTLAAFRLALEDGADGLELDVHLSRDGVPVVMHDDSVNRTSNGSGLVAQLDWRQIASLDAGGWFDKKFVGERVPALVEVFQWNAGRLKLNVEIKEGSAADAVVGIWQRYPETSVVVSSFDHGLLQEVSRREPSLPLGFLFYRGDWRPAVEMAAFCNARSFHPHHRVVDRALIEACRKRRLAVFPWTVDGPRQLEKFWKMKVDGVFCNDPFRTGMLLKHFAAGPS